MPYHSKFQILLDIFFDKKIHYLLALLVLGLADLILGLSIPQQIWAREDAQIQADQDKKQLEVSAQKRKLNDALALTKQRELNFKEVETQYNDAIASREKALSSFKLAQQYQLDNPEISIEKEKKSYTEARAKVDEIEKILSTKRQEYNSSQAQLQIEQTKLDGLQMELESISSEHGKKELTRLKAQLEQEKTVEVRAEVGCVQESLDACKEKACQKALALANEQGSIVMINSLTQVDLGRLTKDEVRSQVKSIILDWKPIEQGWVGDAGRFCKITAKVKGQVPENIGVGSSQNLPVTKVTAPPASETPSTTPVKDTSSAPKGLGALVNAAKNTDASEDNSANDLETEAWEQVKSSKDPVVLKEFIKHYPKGKYTPNAKIYLKTLENSSKLAASKSVPKSNPAVNKSSSPSAEIPEKKVPEKEMTCGSIRDPDYFDCLLHGPKPK